MSRDINNKARLAFFALIMLTSVIALSVAFAGSAAAQEADNGEVILLNETGDKDSTYDSGSPLQDAYDNAGEDYTIIVGSGTFTVPDPQIDGLTIEGDGMDETTLETNQMNPDATNLTISNLEIDASGAAIIVRDNMAANGLHIENVRVTSSDGTTTIAFQTVAKEDNVDKADGLHIENFVADNPSVKGLYLERANNATLSGITVDGVQYTGNESPPSNGIDINLKYDDYKNLTIEDTVVRGVEADDFDPDPTWNAAMAIKARDDGSYSSPAATLTDVTIDNVTVEESVAGLRFGEPGVDYSSNPEGPTDVTITDSTFQNNENYHIEDLSGSVDLTTVQSNNDFVGSTIESDVGIYTSIQAAVDTADAGDTISVGPGTYNESVSISTANVTLEGPNAGIQGTDTTTRSAEAVINSTSKSPAVVVNGSQVILDGFEIRSDGQDGIRLDNSTIDDIAIINNRITDVDGSAYIRDNNPSGAGNGIQIQFTEDGSVDNTVDNVSISRNLISGVSTADTKGRTLAIGINVLPRGNNITRLNITENTITGLKPGDSESEEEARGISIDTHVTVSNDNKFEGGTDDSKGVVNAPVIAGNDIRDFSASGPFEAAGITFFGDNADNTDIGVNDFQITSNTIKNITNQRAGVPSSTVLIGGEYSDLGDDHQVTDNTLVEGAVIRYSTSTPDTDDALNATSNWWGSQNGPSAGSENTYNNGSQGAGVSDNIEFTPWLNASTDNNGQPFAPVTNSSGGQFATIQDAVETADSGDTVEVKPGTYEESVTIETEKITLKGVDEPTIVGAGTSEGSQPHAAIHVNDGSRPVQDVTISGFTVRNPSGNFGIFAGTGSTNKAPDGIGGLVIQNTTVENVSTQVTGSALTGGPAGVGIRADYGTDGNPGIEIKKNEISDVQTDSSVNAVGITLKSFNGDAGFGKDSNGDSASDASSPPATDTDIVNNSITNISGGDGSRTKGISVSGEFEDVRVEKNIIERITAPTETDSNALAITLTENSGTKYDIDDDSNGERIGPRDFEIRNNTIDQVDADSPSAVFIGGYEDLNGDGQSVVSGNNIEDGVVSRVFYTQPGFDADDADILDATENWWGDEDGPNNAETTGAVGEVATQPFLTAPTEELENTDDGTPRRFGTELRLQGGVNTIAFPAPSERTLDESLNTTNVEHVLKYDNTAPDGDNPWDGTSGETPGALNVYVVIVEEGETASLVMEFNNSFDEKNVQLGSTGVSGGWNLVSPTEAADSSSSAFATRNANIQLASENPFQDPQRQPFEADTYEYSPYRGYWVFIDEEDGDSRVASANYDGLTLQEYLENVNLDEGS